MKQVEKKETYTSPLVVDLGKVRETTLGTGCSTTWDMGAGFKGDPDDCKPPPY